jgi:hypothetical protein
VQLFEVLNNHQLNRAFRKQSENHRFWFFQMQNQRTSAGSSYFKNFKEPEVFMKELTVLWSHTYLNFFPTKSELWLYIRTGLPI